MTLRGSKTRRGTTEKIADVVVYVVEVYAFSGLPTNADLTDQEIEALARNVDAGTNLPDMDAVRSGLTNPRFRVSRNLGSRHQAWVQVTWGQRYSAGGGVVATQAFSSNSRPVSAVQPFLRADVVTIDGTPSSLISLDGRRIDRFETESVYRRILPNEISPEVAGALVAANRRRLYTRDGVQMLLSRHGIVPINQSQSYIDTYFVTRDALPAVAQETRGDTTLFAVAALPVLGEYVEPVPGVDSSTAVKTPAQLYTNGSSLSWL